uniref:Uncharacterized protein n=1 Tax=Chrysotila carterae TaxID=13221 RepID=A0A6S9Z2V6_CHRCT
MKNDNTKEGRKVLAQAKAEHRHAYFIQNCFECPLLYIGMKNVILDLLHVGDLNINKQVHKQAIRRHLDEYTAAKVADFYAGTGAKISLVGKNGTRRDKWFKGALRAGMILGNERFPGGVAAWPPSLVCLIGFCKLQKRDKVASAAGHVLPMPHCL